jgi:transmembrane 9 superfamily protein 2/4
MKVPEACQVACSVKLTKADRDAFIRAIDDNYRVHWIVDNLPVGMQIIDENIHETIFTRGFPVGFKTGTGKKTRHYLYNHVRIIIQYHDDGQDEGRNSDDSGSKIVGFRVEPMSIKHSWEGGGDVIPGTTVLSTCNAMNPASSDVNNAMTVDKIDTVVFTYDVKWEKSDVEWGNRWDAYILASPASERVHWFSITNSIMVVLFLTVMIAMILLRTLRKDIAQYNDPAAIEDAKEESGWKLVHGDIFRPPTTFPMLFRL